MWRRFRRRSLGPRRPGLFEQQYALALVTASFALALQRPLPATPVVLVHLVVLVVMLHGTTALIDSEPAFNVVWRHAGTTVLRAAIPRQVIPQ